MEPSIAPKRSSAARPNLGRMLLLASLAALALVVLQVMLGLPGGIGAEDFLGFGNAGDDRDAMQLVGRAWQHLSLIDWRPIGVPLNVAALLYFVLDTIFFIPLYGVLLFEAAHRVASAGARRGQRWLSRAAIGVGGGTLLLMAVDLVENTSGIAKLGILGMPGWLMWPCAMLAPVFAHLCWARATEGKAVIEGLRQLDGPWSQAPRWGRGVAVVALLVAFGLLVAGSFEGAQGAVRTVGAASHAAKLALVLVLAAVLVLLGLLWVFSGDGRRSERAVLRRGLADIVWRVRYVLAALAVLIGLTLVMDQCRDVAIGVADGLFVLPQAWWAWPALSLSVVAVWAMCFSCWLWARLVCRMPGPGAGSHGSDPEVDAALGIAARGVARVLGLVPAFSAALMSGYAARDAIWAATRLADAQVAAPVVLLVFGLASVVGGLLFLRGREHHAGQASIDYHDDVRLRSDWVSAVASEKFAFAWRGGPGPLALPLIALALAVALRCAVALVQPGVPFAFPVVVFTLVGWLGLFGWLSMKEQREARPWFLLLVAAIGILGAVGLTDNHLVRVVTPQASAVLASAPAQVLGTLLLVACIVLAARQLLRDGTAAPGGTHRPPRWSLALGGLFVAGMVVLVAVDRVTAHDAPPTLPPTRPTIDAALAGWVDAMWADEALRTTGQRVYFVASEGGGIRAAYWTARTLAALHARMPAFDRRTFMLSGVSGGAVGEAAYSACLEYRDRREGGVSGVDDCVGRFGQVDLLTPLLGAWLFEDALARLLPTTLQVGAHTLCRQPGCGFLSRGLWFEQGLERADPVLSQGLAARAAARGPGEPRLFLNSTWVESGDRAIASSVHADWQRGFAPARDQLAFVAAGGGAPVDLPLSAAAHNAARFPFVNALGLLRSHEHESGHLADGGYFDNSGTHTVADALAALRRYVDQQASGPCATPSCEARRDWLKNLRPTVIVIQNGVRDTNCEALAEPAERHRCRESAWDLKRPPDAPPAYSPEQAVSAARLGLYVDLIGPLVTVVNAAGTGANGRRAEALVRRECARFNPAHADCVVRLAQLTDGVLYPLGWYLSPTARLALDQKAVRAVDEALGQLR